jgi:hypothetical protein
MTLASGKSKRGDVKMRNRNKSRLDCIAGVLLFCGSVASAELLSVANASFELPETVFALPFVTDWATDGPVIDSESGLNLYTGVFLNTDPNDPNEHISNADGLQLSFIGTQTGNEIVQLLAGTTFQAGGQYSLTVGVARSYSSPPDPNDVLRIALFYLDDVMQRQIVASMDISNAPETGLSPNAIKYFAADSAILISGHPAIGRTVGILLTTLSEFGEQLRFFDMDDVTVEFDACPYALVGDVNSDCVHNLLDFAIYSQTWLIDCIGTPAGPACIVQ